jgi:tetratricopeptide (TPR) repeat protein
LENDLVNDPKLAEELAFFLSVKRVVGAKVRENKLQARHEEWQAKKASSKRLTFRTWSAVAAALVVAVGISWLVFFPADSNLRSLSSTFVSDNLSSISLLMDADGASDSLQIAVVRFNEGDYNGSLSAVEPILSKDPNHSEALKIAGLAALRMGDYQRAIQWFGELGDQKGLFANPGRFYEAIVRIQEGSESNQKKAYILLQEVVKRNLEGKRTAEAWLEQASEIE